MGGWQPSGNTKAGREMRVGAEGTLCIYATWLMAVQVIAGVGSIAG